MALHYLSDAHPVPESMGADVRASLSAALADGDVTLAATARRLGMHSRTLPRRLSDEGLRFLDLLDQVRRDEAHRLLTRTGLPLQTVAVGVGFAEQSARPRHPPVVRVHAPGVALTAPLTGR